MNDQKIKNLIASANEFFWMWLASIAPIIFGSLFIKFHNSDLGYLEIIVRSIGVDIVFAYVATMIAPFLFMLARWITDPKYRKELKRIKFGGLCIFVSISIALTTAGVFSASKGEEIYKETASFSQVASQTGVPQHVNNNLQSGHTNGLLIWQKMDFNNEVLLVCYFLALIIWFYAIYLKNIELPNLVKEEKKRVEEHMDDLAAVQEEEV